MRLDVAVVGGGVVGLSVAWHLGEVGISVVVLERTGINAGQSGVQPGGVRRQWGTEVACRLTSEGAAFWRGAAERLSSPTDFRLDPCGYLFVARSEAALARFTAHVEVQNRCGVPSRIVGADEAAGLVPGLRSHAIVGGAWCGEDGYVDRPQTAVEALAARCEVVNADVTALHPSGGGWDLLLRDGRRVVAGQVVVAAGVESPALVRPLGVDLPIETEERWLFLSAPQRERLLEPLVAVPEMHVAVKQSAT